MVHASEKGVDTLKGHHVSPISLSVGITRIGGRLTDVYTLRTHLVDRSCTCWSCHDHRGSSGWVHR